MIIDSRSTVTMNNDMGARVKCNYPGCSVQVRVVHYKGVRSSILCRRHRIAKQTIASDVVKPPTDDITVTASNTLNPPQLIRSDLQDENDKLRAELDICNQQRQLLINVIDTQKAILDKTREQHKNDWIMFSRQRFDKEREILYWKQKYNTLKREIKQPNYNHRRDQLSDDRRLPEDQVLFSIDGSLGYLM